MDTPDDLYTGETACRRVTSRGAGGQCPPIFFLVLPRYFFKLVFLGGKNVEICDLGQKKPWDFGEDLFFFFWDHLLLVGKFSISVRKSLRISAKTFAPLILILPSPRSREAGDAPDCLCYKLQGVGLLFHIFVM